MFCSLKNRIELQGKFFGILLLLLVLKKKTYILNVKLAFMWWQAEWLTMPILVSQVQTWMALGGKYYRTVTVWRCCCHSSQPSKLKWALGANCFDFALFISLKTRGYPAASRYGGALASRNVPSAYLWAETLDRGHEQKDVQWPGK